MTTGYGYTRDPALEAEMGFRPTPAQYGEMAGGNFNFNTAMMPSFQQISALSGPSMGQQASMNMMPSRADVSSFGVDNLRASAQSGGFGYTGAAQPQGAWGKVGNWLGNGDNLGTVVQGLGSLTQAYLGFKQLGMAKDQLKHQKDSFNKNFANSQKTYNTSLEDRINGRTSSYDGKESDVKSYLAKHKLGG